MAERSLRRTIKEFGVVDSEGWCAGAQRSTRRAVLRALGPLSASPRETQVQIPRLAALARDDTGLASLARDDTGLASLARDDRSLRSAPEVQPFRCLGRVPVVKEPEID